jgi:rRNA-processing protein FCF1
MQVLQYIMGQEWVREVYWDKAEDRTDEQLKKDQEEAKIKIAKKYAKFIPEIDRYYAYKEIILRYAKTHNTSIAPYIYATYDNIE